jgi:hypothetical protein
MGLAGAHFDAAGGVSTSAAGPALPLRPRMPLVRPLVAGRRAAPPRAAPFLTSNFAPRPRIAALPATERGRQV